MVTNTKELIKTEGPWAAYQQAIDFNIAQGLNLQQQHLAAADLVTAWMREFKPELSSSFSWPTRTEYDQWSEGTMSDEKFKELYGFNFQVQ